MDRLWLKAANIWTLAVSHATLGAAAITVLLGADPAADILRGLGA